MWGGWRKEGQDIEQDGGSGMVSRDCVEDTQEGCM